MTHPAPFATELHDAAPPHQAIEHLAHLPHLLMLESSMRHPQLGRYSFLTADPVEWFQPQPGDEAGTFEWLDEQLQKNKMATLPGLPPFQGGVAGLLQYEFNATIESIPATTESMAPVVSLGIYDVVIAWDHQQQRAWILSTGVPETEMTGRQQHAKLRAEQFRDLLNNPPVGRLSNHPSLESDETQPPAKRIACPGHANLTSNFDRNSYLGTIQRVLDYIHAGDIFQVNIAQQLCSPATAHALDLYQQLRVCNPATFAAYFDVGGKQVISASPERLVSVQNGIVETRPIKGTRRRTRHPEVDIDVGQQLLASEKDRAENVMIVDLMRNDLSRVCTDDSVRVSQFVQLESYASVLHLVSAVQGQLKPQITASELLRAVFPGGSITGAPKVRAMEIISELEPTQRGPYCGSMGYFGFDGSIDLNILIRTITANCESWTIPVGGGIVADSDPEREYQETWTKAHAMLKAVDATSSNLSRTAP